FFLFQKIIPGGNTSFDVVFLARVVGNVENTLFINTSNHGVFTYQVVEMYSSGGDLHLELPTGQQGGTKKLW
ncbi:Transmembrane protein, partial [Ophiophagus hannah]